MNVDNYIKNLFTILSNTTITIKSLENISFNNGIKKIVSLLESLSINNKKVIFIGNGGSAAIASHETIDFWKNGKIRAICFNEAALLTCLGNDYGYSHVFEKPIKMFADKGDVLVSISSSGQSENILLGAKAAKDIGCRVITLSGFSNENKLRQIGDINIYVDSQSYGFVELSHQIIMHMILDIIMGKNESSLTKEKEIQNIF